MPEQMVEMEKEKKKKGHTKCWQGYRGTRTVVHLWRDSNMLQAFQKTIHCFFKS